MFLGSSREDSGIIMAAWPYAATIKKKNRPTKLLYPNNLKKWEFDKEAPRLFCQRRAAVLIDTARAFGKKAVAKLTRSKTNFLSCLGIIIRFHILYLRIIAFFPKSRQPLQCIH